MARFELETKEIERLQATMRQYPSVAERSINEVFHGPAPQLVKDAVRELMPQSGAKWRGKLPAAKGAKQSLTEKTENLRFAVKTSPKYSYLYFPDDGSNTLRHRGDQQFFARGGHKVEKDIVDRCVAQIIENFNK